MIVHVDFVLYLQHLFALFDKSLQVVEAFFSAYLIKDGTKEQFQVLCKRLVLAVGVCEQSTMSFIKKVEQKCKLLSRILRGLFV